MSQKRPAGAMSQGAPQRGTNETRACVGCMKRHPHKRWHVRDPGTAGEFAYCHNSHMRHMREFRKQRKTQEHESRAGEEETKEAWHPAQPHVLHAITHVDGMGCLISSLRLRPDVQGLTAMGALTRASGTAWSSTKNVLLFLGFALQAYFIPPMQELWALMRVHSPQTMTCAQATRCWAKLEAQMKDIRFVQGAFVFKPRGRQGKMMLKNPSERKVGAANFHALAADLPAWRRACERLAPLFEKDAPLLLDEARGAIATCISFKIHQLTRWTFFMREEPPGASFYARRPLTGRGLLLFRGLLRNDDN